MDAGGGDGDDVTARSEPFGRGNDRSSGQNNCRVRDERSPVGLQYISTYFRAPRKIPGSIDSVSQEALLQLACTHLRRAERANLSRSPLGDTKKSSLAKFSMSLDNWFISWYQLNLAINTKLVLTMAEQKKYDEVSAFY